MLQEISNIIKDQAKLDDLYYKIDDSNNDIITFFAKKNKFKYAFKISYHSLISDISWNGSYIHKMAYEIDRQFMLAERAKEEKEYEVIFEKLVESKEEKYKFVDIGTRFLDV